MRRGTGAVLLHGIGPSYLAQFFSNCIPAPGLWGQDGAHTQCGEPGGIVGLVEEQRRDQLRNAGLQALGQGADAAMMRQRGASRRQPLQGAYLKCRALAGRAGGTCSG